MSNMDGCMKWSEVDISLNHYKMRLFSLHKWAWTPKSGANLAGATVEGCTHMPSRQHTSGSNSLYMSNMDVWSGLRWISASTMMLWQCFPPQENLTSHLTSQMGGQRGWCNNKGASICPWDSIPMAQTLCICLIWMWVASWGGYQPQLWCNGTIIHSTSDLEFPNLGPTWPV